MNPGTVNCPVVVNIEAYEALSEEHRAALDSSVDEAIEHYLDNYGKLLAQWDEILKEKGVQEVHLGEDQLAQFRQVAEPVRDAWVESMSAQGLPAMELYDLIQSTLSDMR